jgi:predicted RNase H-like nuclease (RuvC/YqgF family)
MVSIEEYNERRLTNVENAITKLTEISADLNKVLAVQEQRLTQNERLMYDLEETVESRRAEYENRIQNVYDVMNREDNKILEELELMREEQKEQHKSISNKINDMQKIIWVYMGGFSVIVFLLTNGSKFLTLFGMK